ncbi:MAG: sugar ABC transporter substrate-binding protein [Desulfobacteraceae bacterium]|nr:sugar ABC transporter substrate-binding protein [Desulfobacteraceae bacterium]
MKKTALIVFSWILFFNLIHANGQVPDVFKKKKLNIVLLIEYSAGDYFARYMEGVREEARSLGFHLEIMDARSKKDKMVNMLNSAVVKNSDGIMISHCSSEKLLKGVKTALRKGIPLVTVDCDMPLKDIVRIWKDDHKIAELGLKKVIKDTNGKANLVHIWVPGYQPMEKRMKAYQEIISQYPGIKEIRRFGKATNNTSLYTQVTMTSVLKKHPPGSVNVVWATWNEFARGAARAIMQAGRNEIKLYGIDINDEDIKMLQDPKNPWTATAGVDSKSIGKVHVRILAYKIAGKETPEKYLFQPVLITKEVLPSDVKVSVENLHNYVPEWGDPGDFSDAWINELKKRD